MLESFSIMWKHNHSFAGASRAGTVRERRLDGLFQRFAGAPALVALALAGAVSAQAQTLSANAQRQINALLSEKDSRTPAQVKMDSHLVHAAQILRGQPVHPDFPSPPGELEAVRLDARNAVEVDIGADVTPALLTFIGDLGGTVVNSFAEYRSIRASLPLLAVEQIAARDEVRQIRVADPGYHASGPARSPWAPPALAARGLAVRARLAEILAARKAAEPPALGLGRLFGSLGSAFFVGGPDSPGDTAHQGPVARLNYGVDGTGVKIGVLSDGVNSRAAEQAAGRLPAVTVITGQAGSGDEGTAMLEIVYTLAPGATLYFATADGGTSQMATNMQLLANAGCNVLVDDTVYFDEGVFEDGVVAAKANALALAGVFYFSSAGNSGSFAQGTSGTWQGDFVDSGTTIAAITAKEPPSYTYTVHSFGANNYDTLTSPSSIPVTGGGTGWYELKWSDPLGGSNNDYDFFLLDSTMATVIASSTAVQNGTQDPEEFFPGTQTLTNACNTGGNAGTCRIVIVKRASALSRTLYIDTERGHLAVATSGATFGHNAASGAFTIAASDGRYAGPPVRPACSGFTSSSSCNNGVQAYSSDGPRQMFFNSDGSPITPGNVLMATNGGTVLNKPDITAADCVTTGLLAFTPFCGTSAAAPHAAAIAALAIQAQPNLTPAQLRAAMTASAIDIGATGWDANSGAGIAMAPGTVNAACGYSASAPAPVSSVAGNVALSIQAGQNCPWSITGLPSWIPGATPASGKGPATVILSVAANSGSQRTGTLSLNAGTLATGASASITQSSVQPLAIATGATLLTGFVNGAYSQDLAATGGSGAYTWTIIAGALPAGLALTGARITGTPTAAAGGTTSSFTLQVADSNGAKASQAFSLTVVPGSGASALAQVGVLSQFAVAGYWSTTIYIINNTTAAVPVRLQFYGDDGTPAVKTPDGTTVPLTVIQQGDSQPGSATTLDRVLNANTTLIVSASGLGLETGVSAQGWVNVLATAPLAGYAVFTFAPQGLTPPPQPWTAFWFTPFEGTVPLQSVLSASTITLPFDNAGGFTTGIAIGSLTGSAATITATFFDLNGNTLPLSAPQTISLAANGHTAFMVNTGPAGQDWSSFMGGQQGIVKFTGTALMGLGLRASPYGTVTSVPAVLQ